MQEISTFASVYLKNIYKLDKHFEKHGLLSFRVDSLVVALSQLTLSLATLFQHRPSNWGTALIIFGMLTIFCRVYLHGTTEDDKTVKK